MQKRCVLHAVCLRQEYTHTQIVFNIYCFFVATVVTVTRLNVMMYVHSMYCSYFYILGFVVCFVVFTPFKTEINRIILK